MKMDHFTQNLIEFMNILEMFSLKKITLLENLTQGIVVSQNFGFFKRKKPIDLNFSNFWSIIVSTNWYRLKFHYVSPI